MSYRVNLVEDEKKLNDLLCLYMQKEGWSVQGFMEGEAARLAIEEAPDIWILDIMLSDIDGYLLLAEIKEKTPAVPVIFISARDESMDRIVGLEMGSDDYLSKPFLPRELIIRIKKILQRGQVSLEKNKGILLSGDYRVDEAKRMVFQGKESLDLTSKEFDLVILLSKNLKKAFAREEILDHVWGRDYFGSDRVVDDLVRRLRKKMPELKIETLYGFGYRLNEK